MALFHHFVCRIWDSCRSCHHELEQPPIRLLYGERVAVLPRSWLNERCGKQKFRLMPVCEWQLLQIDTDINACTQKTVLPCHTQTHNPRHPSLASVPHFTPQHASKTKTASARPRKCSECVVLANPTNCTNLYGFGARVLCSVTLGVVCRRICVCFRLCSEPTVSQPVSQPSPVVRAPPHRNRGQPAIPLR